jgi:hypothetical protein
LTILTILTISAILISVSCIAIAPAELDPRLTGTGVDNGVLIVPAHTAFGEDWSVAGSRPTHLPVCLPNANLANRTIVLDSITIRQLINYFEREFPTVRQQQQQALFGITVQRADTVGSYYTKLKKIARLANIGDDEFHCRFIGSFTSDN